MPARRIKPPCSEKCRLKCSTKISDESRKKVHTDFWNMANLANQRIYIVCKTTKKNRSHHSKKLRTNNYAYYMT